MHVYNITLQQLEPDFQISKHDLFCQRENWITGHTIVSVNKHSPLALHQNDAMVSIETVWLYCQLSIQNLNIPNFKWGWFWDAHN